MRQVFLDTETTGFDPKTGDRVVEVAGVEVINRRITQVQYHQYINPERDMPEAAQNVHGLSIAFLKDKPVFADIARELIDFIADAELIMHNAPFDVGFLNHEFQLLGLPQVAEIVAEVTDTLKMAKDIRPGQRNNLDALCRHYGIDNSTRTLHGALLDSELLAEVYFAMTRGQESLVMDLAGDERNGDASFDGVDTPLIVKRATESEVDAHNEYLSGLDGQIWPK